MPNLISAETARPALALACTLIVSCASPGTYRPGVPADPNYTVAPASDKYDTAPKLISGTVPTCPNSGAGSVVIAFEIRPDGMTDKFEIVEAFNEEAALRAMVALKDWRFSPGLKGGAPITVRVQQEFIFEK